MKEVVDPRWRVENTIDISPILSQPFYYLGKGCQCFVFLSADQSCVIKFFKEKHLKKKDRRQKVFDGCFLAYHFLQEDCGLLYMHLCQEPLPVQMITLYDKLGFAHTIDLEMHSFYIQKKGTPFLSLSEDEKIQYSEAINSLINKRALADIADKDPALYQNLAICEGRPIFVDVGQFYSSKTMLSSSTCLVQ